MTRETQSKLLGEFYAEKKNILKLKGEDYANEDVLSNFKTAGANIGISAEQQCLSLIATKVARLGNLLSGKTPNNESVSDSILDLSNYTDLLYCLVNEGKTSKEVLEKLNSQPLGFKVSKAQEKRWENVKPKAIINQINWNDINEPIKEEDIFYKGGEPIIKLYEPKVGDRFWNKDFEKSLKIIRIVEDLIVMKDYSEIFNFCYLSTYDFLNELKNGNLKKIN